MALHLQTTPPEERLKVREGAVRPYLRAIRAHIVLFTLIVLATLGGGIAYVSWRSPVYEATAQLLITPLPQDDTTFRGLSLLRDAGDPARTAQTAAALIDTQATAALTAERLGQGYTAKKVLDRTDVKPLGDSDVLAVTARADEPDEAAQIANQFTTSALVVRRRTLRTEVAAAIAEAKAQLNATPRRSPLAAEIAGRLTTLRSLSDGQDSTLSSAQRAISPSSAAGPPAVLVVVLSLLAGLTIGAGAALVLELIDWRIRDEDDLVKLGSPQALARLPKLSRQEARVAAGLPLAVPPPVREGFRSLQIQLERNSAEHRSVMITSASTGDGKTSSAINLAAEVAGAGYRTLLVDLDLRKPSLGPQLGLDAADGGVLSLMDMQATLPEVLVSAPELPGVQLLLAPTNAFALAEGLGQTAGRWLPGILDQAKELADYVIIDTAPLGEVSDALRVATQVDEILLVARLGHTRKDGFQTMLELLEHASCTPSGLILIGSAAATGSYSYYGHPRLGPGTAGVGAKGWRRYRPAGPPGQTNARPAAGSSDGEPAAEAAHEPRRD
ncbi:MAG TPA: AAA family ATPase [Solirubrobacterales bacterium]|nr:AAA family ATPase [Solirubrobacterales bacterium]